MIVLKQKRYRGNEKREWVRKWIQRRNNLDISNTLINELTIEELKSFHNF